MHIIKGDFKGCWCFACVDQLTTIFFWGRPHSIDCLIKISTNSRYQGWQGKHKLMIDLRGARLNLAVCKHHKALGS